MATVEIDIDKITAAVDAIKDLPNTVDLERNKAVSATPIGLPMLGDGTLGTKTRWLYDNTEELETRRDLARLLDTEGTGQASYEVTSDTLTNVQDLLGQQLSSRAEDLDYETSDEDAELFAEMMTRWQNDPEVMSSMYQDLGPDGAVGVMSNIDAAGNVQALDPETLNTLAEHMRTGLATASRAPDFPAAEYGEQMAYWSTPPMWSDEDREAYQDRFPSMAMNGASVMAYYMEGGNHSGDFVLGAARGMDEFERAAGSEQAQIWYAHNSHSMLDTNSDSGSVDPMASVMHQLGENPEAGLEFFTEDTGDWNRQGYYFNDRTWEMDGYGGIAHAVEGIGTDAENLENDPEATTMLVSKFMDEVADSEGFNAEDAKPASPYVADLMKFYMPSVDTALRFPNGDGDAATTSLSIDNFGTIDPAPVFYTDDLDSLMQVSMGTPDGMQSIAEGVGTYQQTQINNIAAQLEANPDDPGLRSELRDVIQRSSALQGFSEYSVGQVEIEGAESRDQQRQAFIDLVGDAAGLVPMPGADQVGDIGSKLIEFGWSQATDLGTDAAGEAFTSEAAGATDKAEDRAAAGTNRTKVNTFFALAQAGVIPEDEIPPGFLDESGSLIDPGDIPPDQMSSYAQSAMSGVNDYVSNFDIEGAYKNEFLSYYAPASDGG